MEKLYLSAGRLQPEAISYWEERTNRSLPACTEGTSLAMTTTASGFATWAASSCKTGDNMLYVNSHHVRSIEQAYPVAVVPLLLIPLLNASDLGQHEFQLALVEEAEVPHDLGVEDFGQTVELLLAE